ncbi:MAG TPA: VOC family protein [Anaeromyxobacteraceae bacterium]|nr:VOC family protein [Anaeromyxobacteraceae bacterium]
MARKTKAKMAKKVAPKRGAARPKARARAKPKRVTPIPEYLHAVTPNLVFKDSVAAIAFYAKAFGAKELSRMPTPDGKGTWHAEIRIGDSVIFMNDESPMNPIKAASAERPATSTLHLYVKDCDATIARAVEAGATISMPAADMFWGDRMGGIVDPFGIPWGIATRRAKLTPSQLKKAGEDFARKLEPVAYPHEAGSEEYGPGAD